LQADRARRLGGRAALVALVAASAWMAAGAAANPDFVLVRSNHGGAGNYPDALRGPLDGFGVPLGPGGFVSLLLVACVLYLVVLALARDIGPRAAVAAIVGAHLAFALGPALLSSDVFNYIGYARLDVVHHLNPYEHALDAAPGDASFPYVGWQHSTSAYGPLFTLLTLPLAKLSLPASLWILKAATALASLVCVGLVAACARRLGRDPVTAAMFVGLNPVLLAFAVGGAHNDLLMMVAVLAGVYLLLGRQRGGAGAVAAGAAVKTSAALFAPFAVLGAGDRGRALAWALGAGAASAALALAVFGTELFSVVRVLGDEAQAGSLHSVPKSLASATGMDIDFLRPLGTAVALGAVLVLLRRAWNDRSYWVRAAGWAALAVLATTTYLLPWYVVWLLPFTALAAAGAEASVGQPAGVRDRHRARSLLHDQRLWALTLCAFVVALRVPTIA
jgi:hypothetical protein